MTSTDSPRRAYEHPVPADLLAPDRLAVPDRVAATPPGQAMAPAKAPVGLGAAPLIAQVLALGLIAVGVVAVRDALVAVGVVTGSSWLVAAVRAVDGMSLQPWMIAVALAALLIGIILLVIAVKPRPRKAVSLRSSTGVFLRTGGVAKIAKDAVSDVDGVLSSRVRATRSAVTVRADITATSGEASSIKQAIDEAVSSALAGLERTPRVKIATKSEMGD